MLFKELLAKNNIQQKDMAKLLQIDKSDMSKLANYKCLPTPEQANKICQILNCNILDIYNKKEIDLILGVKKASRNKEDNLYYRLSVRLNKSGCNCLKRKNLNKLGYKTIKQWVEACIFGLKNQLKVVNIMEDVLNEIKDINKNNEAKQVRLENFFKGYTSSGTNNELSEYYTSFHNLVQRLLQANKIDKFEANCLETLFDGYGDHFLETINNLICKIMRV